MRTLFKPLTMVFTAVAAGFGQLIAQGAPAAQMVHIRGSVQSINAKTIIVSTKTGSVKVALPAGYQVVDVIRSSKSMIKPGSFLGIASMTEPNGSQRAVEIVVFPEAMRGAGEGNYAWDYPSSSSGTGSKMTNGTMTKMTNGTLSSKMTNGTMSSKMTNGTVNGASGTTLTLNYKGIGGTGSQRLVIPRGIPIVTLKPGSPSQLTPGAKVFVFAAKQRDGSMTAGRVMVGIGGIAPPM